LHGALVFFSGGATIKCAEIFSLTGFWIFLARIKAIFARREFSDHANLLRV
jgi:hypothetical protein